MASTSARKRYFEVLHKHQLGDPELISCLCNIHVKWSLSHQIDMLEEAGLIMPDLTRLPELYEHTYAVVSGQRVRIERGHDWTEEFQVYLGEVIGVTANVDDGVTILVKEVNDADGGDGN